MSKPNNKQSPSSVNIDPVLKAILFAGASLIGLYLLLVVLDRALVGISSALSFPILGVAVAAGIAWVLVIFQRKYVAVKKDRPSSQRRFLPSPYSNYTFGSAFIIATSLLLVLSNGFIAAITIKAQEPGESEIGILAVVIAPVALIAGLTLLVTLIRQSLQQTIPRKVRNMRLIVIVTALLSFSGWFVA